MTSINNKIAVVAIHNSELTKAKELALRLNLPLFNHKQIPHHFLFLLAVTPDRLELRENITKPAKPIFVDFLSPQLNYRIKHGSGKKQLIAKAIGLKNKKQLKVLDATAGLGVDAFVLTSLGCEVLMLERSPIISALLEDGLARLKNARVQVSKLSLIPNIQSAGYINKIIQNKKKGDGEMPDVIYLDPMYPKRQKSALNKKVMRILYKIVGEDADAYQLLELALKCAKNRVVVKRPKFAESLGLLKPNLQFSANGSSRYDVYFPK